MRGGGAYNGSVRYLGWGLLLLGIVLLWPILGPLLTIAAVLFGVVAALTLGAVLVAFGWILALALLALGLFVAALKWALPLGILLLGLWLLSANRRNDRG